MSEFIEKYGTDDPRLGHIITNGNLIDLISNLYLLIIDSISI